jgi:hypothetical protein
VPEGEYRHAGSVTRNVPGYPNPGEHLPAADGAKGLRGEKLAAVSRHC